MRRIQVRRGTAAAWTAADPTLAAGEIGFETDTGEFKIGDGTTAWISLAYAGGGGGAPDTADYLVGTAQGGLSAEIVVGATPGGELGGTWASPTVDATHSGSTHAAVQAAAEATAAAALSAHLTDTSDAHDASAISADSTTLVGTGTDVQAVLEELDNAIAGLVGATGPGAVLDYVEFTSPVAVTATVEASANTVVSGSAVAYDGSTVVLVEFYAPSIEVGADAALVVTLWDGATDIGRLGNYAGIASGSTTAVLNAPAYLARRLTPSAATHTYHIKAWRAVANGNISAGAGGVGAYMPGFIRITKV